MDTLFCRLQVWKDKHWENEYIEHFPNHFPQGPWPCHMLGGCRSSLETGVQHDGWHALADTLGHLIFLSEFLGTVLVEIHPFKKIKIKKISKQTELQYKCRVCIAFEKMLQSGQVKAWVGENGEVCWKRSCTTHCSLWKSFEEICRWVGGKPECNFMRFVIGPKEIQCPSTTQQQGKETDGGCSCEVWSNSLVKGSYH